MSQILQNNSASEEDAETQEEKETLAGLSSTRGTPSQATSLEDLPENALASDLIRTKEMMDQQAALALVARLPGPVAIMGDEKPVTKNEEMHRLEQEADLADESRHLARQTAEEKIATAEIIFAADADATSQPRMTPDYLTNTVMPYLNAIAEIQHIVDEIQGREPREINITSIKQKSPISVEFGSTIKEAAELLERLIIPWRRKYTKKIADYKLLHARVEIENERAEIAEKYARMQRDKTEAKRIAVEAEKYQAEAEKLKLENEQLRLELQRARIQLALDILDEIKPDLSKEEKAAYKMKLLPPLDTVIFSDLQPSTIRQGSARQPAGTPEPDWITGRINLPEDVTRSPAATPVSASSGG